MIGIPYSEADCVKLTLRYLEQRGIIVRDPQQHPEDWVACKESEAVVLTYRKRRHIAPIFGDGYVIETHQGSRSRLVRIDKLRARDLEFWRPR